MSKINYEEAIDYFKKFHEGSWAGTTPLDFFLDGVEYAVELASKEQQEVSKKSHYFFTSTTGPQVVEHYYPTREEAENGAAAVEELYVFLNKILKCEVSEIIERPGSIEEAYSILPSGEKFTVSDVKKFYIQ